jgi:hypothetical protein
MSPAPTTMLYKLGSMLDVDGTKVDYLIVEDSKLEQAIADGWNSLQAVIAKAQSKDEPIKDEEIVSDEPEAKRRGRPPKASAEG